MPLSVGTRLGPYEILAPIGTGGMGEVYRARDVKLDREVALKVLPDTLTHDPEKLARFEREAKVLASLNHPNIGQIYAVEQDALVMELIEGDTLHGPLPLDTALHYARQIADALEAAHEKGIVHRDLKPSNIMITPEGVVKVLDFGLAKSSDDSAASGDPTLSPTFTMSPTRGGLILGTAAYMSPEQARGRKVDKRADIWAFGVVLFEMITGQRPFLGEDLTEIMASVVKEEPRIELAPPRVRRLLRKCLEKDPKKRLRDIGDVWELLEDAASQPSAERMERATPPPRFGWAPWGVAGFLAVLSAVALWGWLRPRPVEPQPVVRLDTPLPKSIGGGPGLAGGPVLSRDGSRLAFVGGAERQIYVRMLDELDSRPIPGTEGAGFLCFSPDGQWISYNASGQLRKIAIAGGPPQTLAEARTLVGPSTQSWGEDDNILYANDGVIMRIPSSGGKPEMVATPDARKGEISYFGAQALPGSDRILFSMMGSSAASSPKVVAFNPKTGAKKKLLDGLELAQYLPSKAASQIGYLIYSDLDTATLMAVAFDVKRLEVTSSAVSVLEGIRDFVGPFFLFGISDSGTLAYVPGASASNSTARTLVWVDRKGVEQPLSAPPRAYIFPKISPDGERVAVEIQAGQDPTLASVDIWVYDLIRGALSRLTFQGANLLPLWTPDGKRLIYASGPNPYSTSLVSGPADGTAPPSPLTSDGITRLARSISGDGKLLIGVGSRNAEGGGNEFWALSLADGGKPRPFLNSRSVKSDPQISPDGRWVAYQSLESGRYEIYVVPYPTANQKFPISTDGGVLPRWSRNGRELFYWSARKMMAVDIQTTPVFRAGVPKMLFEGTYSPTGYDVAPDGQRFLRVKPPAVLQTPADQLIVVVNWLEELRRRMPVGK